MIIGKSRTNSFKYKKVALAGALFLLMGVEYRNIPLLNVYDGTDLKAKA